MKALIIAAGDGTRMQPVTRGRHKSLMSLLGLKIMERVILAAKEAGIREFVIVTGYRGRELQQVIGNGSKYDVAIEDVQNDEWEKANGLSVLKAKAKLQNNFVLLMSDHVFDYHTLQRLVRIKLQKDECALAIDRTLGSVLDVADTTKVVARSGRVHTIGKHLEKFNAYDTGRFLIKTPITPNMISVFIPTLAILTFFILSRGTQMSFIFGGILIQFLSIIDGCDGEISRLKFQKSVFGAWLDPILDRYVDMFLIAGMAYGYWNATGNDLILLMAVMVIFADVLQDYMSAKFFMITGKKLRSSLDFPFKRDLRMLVLAIGAVTGQILVSFLVFAILVNLKVVLKVVNVT